MTSTDRKYKILIVVLAVLRLTQGFSLCLSGAHLVQGVAVLTGPGVHAGYRRGMAEVYGGAPNDHYGMCPGINSSHHWTPCTADEYAQRAHDYALRSAATTVFAMFAALAIISAFQALMKQWPTKNPDNQQQQPVASRQTTVRPHKADDRQQMKDEIRIKILEQLRQDIQQNTVLLHNIATAVTHGFNQLKLQPQPVYFLQPPQSVDQFPPPQLVGVPVCGLPRNQLAGLRETLV